MVVVARFGLDCGIFYVSLYSKCLDKFGIISNKGCACKSLFNYPCSFSFKIFDKE